MATVDQSGIVGKIRNRPIGNQLEQLLKSAAEAIGIERVYVISGSQPGTHGQSTGSTRHNNGRAADVRLIDNGVALSFSDSHGGKVADFVRECAARGATGIGAGTGYMGNKTIHVGYGLTVHDHSKLVWGAGGSSANAPQWLRNSAQAGWSNPEASSFATAELAENDYDEAVAEPGSGDIELGQMALSGAKSLHNSVDNTDGDACCDGMLDDITTLSKTAPAKPSVEYIESPYQFSRGGTDIDHVVLHYTTTRSITSTISHFLKNEKEIAAHYVIGRDGRIVQMVKDHKKCYHGNSKNNRSIGIEHSAAAGDQITTDQEIASLKLIRWLMNEYDIPVTNIIPHKCAPKSTSCPGELFGAYGANGDSGCSDHNSAVQAWLKAKL